MDMWIRAIVVFLLITFIFVGDILIFHVADLWKKGDEEITSTIHGLADEESPSGFNHEEYPVKKQENDQKEETG